MKVIQFDVDGVLADFGGGYIKRYREIFGVTLPRPDRWDESTNPATWRSIKEDPEFWQSLEPLVGWEEFWRIEELSQQNQVYFVTHRMGVRPKQQTEVWLREQGIANPCVIVSGRKADVAQALGVTHAIDDKAGNAVAISYISRDTRSYLLDAAYNRFDHTIIGGSVRRVKQLTEFLEEVES